MGQFARRISAAFVLGSSVGHPVAAFVCPTTTSTSTAGRVGSSSSSSHTSLGAWMSIFDPKLGASSVDAAAVADAKLQISNSIANTDRGRSSLDDSQRTAVHSLLSDLEDLCPLSAPARDDRMEGPWIVLYTDAPPPSNGRLGFLNGIAKQVIDLDGGRYRNELYVGGKGADDDEDAWLSAVLDATWVEWDGVYLEDEDGNSGGSSGDVDPGATTWKVDFESITLSVFGMPLFTQQFKAGTSRTWKMTYLDDDTRIVRAGKTGRGEDDWVFYMRRGGTASSSS